MSQLIAMGLKRQWTRIRASRPPNCGLAVSRKKSDVGQMKEPIELILEAHWALGADVTVVREIVESVTEM
jgi:hypothetical protein